MSNVKCFADLLLLFFCFFLGTIAIAFATPSTASGRQQASFLPTINYYYNDNFHTVHSAA